jgi:hypothetical protein
MKGFTGVTTISTANIILGYYEVDNFLVKKYILSNCK